VCERTERGQVLAEAGEPGEQQAIARESAPKARRVYQNHGERRAPAHGYLPYQRSWRDEPNMALIEDDEKATPFELR
jgi:hypothetical protein